MTRTEARQDSGRALARSPPSLDVHPRAGPPTPALSDEDSPVRFDERLVGRRGRPTHRYSEGIISATRTSGLHNPADMRTGNPRWDRLLSGAPSRTTNRYPRHRRGLCTTECTPRSLEQRASTMPERRRTRSLSDRENRDANKLARDRPDGVGLPRGVLTVRKNLARYVADW